MTPSTPWSAVASTRSWATGLAITWLLTDDGAEFELVGDGYRLDEGIGITVRHDDHAWLQPVNDALQAMLADGTYAEINARYSPFSIY